MNYTSTGVYITCKSIGALTDLESTGVAYTNNVEPMCKNYKSISVAYNKKVNLVHTIYKSTVPFNLSVCIDAFVLRVHQCALTIQAPKKKTSATTSARPIFFSYMEHPVKTSCFK
jgi:hypothetical protein